MVWKVGGSVLRHVLQEGQQKPHPTDERGDEPHQPDHVPINLLDLLPAEIEKLAESMGAPGYRGRSVVLGGSDAR